MKITKRWIAELVPGRSFVDIGGLFKTRNEQVTTAAKAGASSLVMADIAPLGHKMWRDFDAHCAEQGVTDYRNVSADIIAPNAPDRIGRHDVVHCSGVIYHMPDPVGCLRNLRSITNDYLILVSMVVPERIETHAGTLSFSGGATMFVPALSDHQRAILREYFERINAKVHTINGPDIEGWIKRDGSPRFGPWWWLFTPNLLRRIIEISGFEVVADAPVVAPRSHGFLCRVS